MLKMEISETNAATTTISPSHSSSPQSLSPSSSSNPPPPNAMSPPPPAMVMSPCAACKILRRRCADKCVLAPYFPPTDPSKFSTAHRVFGASNIIKFLQELPESQRTDAVSSMVYEASMRIRDPVYGCAGAISQLQRQVSELQEQLAKAQAEMVNLQLQQANLLALIYMDQPNFSQQHPFNITHPLNRTDEFISSPEESNDMGVFEDDNNNSSSMSLWEPLWT